MLGTIAWAVFGGRQIVIGVVKFVSTPFGQVVAFAGALLVTFLAADVHARVRDHAACEARIEAVNADWRTKEANAAAAYNKARARRDADITAAITKDNGDREAKLKAQAAALQKKVDQYAKAAKARPMPIACGATQSLIDNRRGLLAHDP